LPALIRLDREVGGKPSDQWDLKIYRTETAKVHGLLEIFEQLLGGRQWLVGDALSPADLALAQPLTILERFGLDLAAMPGLADLAERLAKRTSILSARRPPGSTAASLLRPGVPTEVLQAAAAAHKQP
jgi:glutathione S-transferase